MKAYYKIGEIAKIYDISKDSLMYYETLGILEPVRNEKGYRLYSITDIWKLNLIKELRMLDVPMKRIKEHMEERTVSRTLAMFQEEINLIDEKVDSLLRQKAIIERRILKLEETVSHVQIGEIKEVYLPKRSGILLNEDITRDADMDILMQRLQKEYALHLDIIGSKSIGAVFDEHTFAKGIYNVFEAAFCMVEGDEGEIVLQEGNYLTCTYKGVYKNNAYYIQQMQSYLNRNGYVQCGKALEIYRVDIHETAVEEEFITEIQLPFAKKAMPCIY